MDKSWDEELGEFLSELTRVQADCLALLGRKQQLLAALDLEGLAALEPTERQLVDRLQSCQTRRNELLAKARSLGLAGESLTKVTRELPGGLLRESDRKSRLLQMESAARQWQFLRHRALSQWLLTQRLVLHLSQLLEIIATSGQIQPTYKKDHSRVPDTAGGALVNEVI